MISAKKETDLPPTDAQKPLVLIGLMGAGKSTIGKYLAKALARDFFDVDAEIEKIAGKSIADIFAQEGEAGFRLREKTVMQALMQKPSSIIATGGGAWMQPEIQNLIRTSGISIWLNASLETLLAHVKKDGDTRPLLTQKNQRDILQKLIDQRYVEYAKADITINTDAKTAQAITKNLQQALIDFAK
jgi:shikimate kinase